MEYSIEQKTEAIRKAKELKKFYTHLTSYVLVNLGLLLLNLIQIYTSGGEFELHKFWVIWVILGWGIGIFSQYLKIKVGNVFLGENWEEKKVREILEKQSGNN